MPRVSKRVATLAVVSLTLDLIGCDAGSVPRKDAEQARPAVPAGGIPKPGPLQVHLKDDHLQYAITWFLLAGAVVIAFGVWLRAQRRGMPSRE